MADGDIIGRGGALNANSKHRIVASGSTNIPSGGAPTSVAGSVTRDAGEVLQAYVFPTGSGAGSDRTFAPGVAATAADVHWYFARTTTADQYTFVIENETGADVTVDWVILGIVV